MKKRYKKVLENNIKFRDTLVELSGYLYLNNNIICILQIKDIWQHQRYLEYEYLFYAENKHLFPLLRWCNLDNHVKSYLAKFNLEVCRFSEIMDNNSLYEEEKFGIL